MLRTLLGGGDIQSTLLSILYMLPAILFSLSCHEWAHAFAAYKCGDMTARNLGRMTLNPFSHIDPIGFIMLLFVGFGWAKPVPVNLRNTKNPRRDDLIISLAGILMNIFLLFVFMGIFLFALPLVPENYIEIAANLLTPFLGINAVLAVFNLLPVPPLDGYRVVESLLIKVTGPKPFLFLQRYGTVILIAVLILSDRVGIIGMGANLLMDAAIGFYGLFM